MPNNTAGLMATCMACRNCTIRGTTAICVLDGGSCRQHAAEGLCPLSRFENPQQVVVENTTTVTVQAPRKPCNCSRAKKGEGRK